MLQSIACLAGPHAFRDHVIVMADSFLQHVAMHVDTSFKIAMMPISEAVMEAVLAARHDPFRDAPQPITALFRIVTGRHAHAPHCALTLARKRTSPETCTCYLGQVASLHRHRPRKTRFRLQKTSRQVRCAQLERTCDRSLLSGKVTDSRVTCKTYPCSQAH